MTSLIALLAAPSAYAGAVGLHLTVAHRRFQRATGEPGPPPEVHLAEVRRKWLLRRWAFGPAEVQPEAPSPARPVLLVHGFVGRPTHLRGHQRALHAAGRATRLVDLGWQFRGVPSYAPALERALEAVDTCDVVAHSMGGVVLRHVLHTRPDLRDRVHAAVTLGTPHAGTVAAELPVDLPADVVDLRERSRFLAELPPLVELIPRARRVAVGARWDTVVFPLANTLPAGMEPVVLEGFGHNGLLTET